MRSNPSLTYVRIRRYGSGVDLAAASTAMLGAMKEMLSIAVDEVTGYRWYRPSQLHRAELIRLGRAAQMSLDELHERWTRWMCRHW